MIITNDDIKHLERELDDYNKQDEIILDYDQFDPVKYFGERPYLLLPMDFSENRKLYFNEYLWEAEYENEKEQFAVKKQQIEKAILDTEIFIKKMGLSENIEFMNRDLEYAFKSDNNGSWYWFDGIDRNELYFNGYESKNIPVEKLLKTLKEITKNPDNRPHSIIYPRAFIDFNYPLTEKVNRNVINTISSIYNRDKSLEDINPYEFEDIVAELLENIGFQIYQTPKSRDGGRDMIARGEMAPGFPINIAVEVKKKKKVPIKDIRDTLYANRNYPKIMVVTTGTFSAGVYKCQKAEENLYRLDLKDGIAVSQLIHGYIKER